MWNVIKNTYKDYKVLQGEHKKTCDFAFLVHPRDIKDVNDTYPIFRYIPDRFLTFFLKRWWPLRIAPIKGLHDHAGNERFGWVISCTITADMMMKDRGLASREIVRSAHLARGHGAKVLGLGALSASLSRGGLDITEDIQDVRVTTGRLYTIINICGLVDGARTALAVDKADITVAVVGAAGSIGAGVSQLLARSGFRRIHLVDISSKHESVEEVAGYLHNLSETVTVTVSDDLKELHGYDVIVTATNHPEALIKKENISEGAIIVDDAQPSDVSKELFSSNKHLVLEGGVVDTGSVDIPFRFGLQNRYDVFSCMAELLILVASGIDEQSPVGRDLKLDFDALDALRYESDRLGFKPGAFQNHKKVYSKEEIQNVVACKSIYNDNH